MEEKIKYWIELSDYDVDTAEAMLQTNRFLYVGFMCHQVIEKILKACYIHKLSEIPPFTYSLSNLANKCNIYNLFSEEQKNFIDILEPMQIEGRYPSQKDKLFKSLSEVKCLEILNQTKELQLWIKAIYKLLKKYKILLNQHYDLYKLILFGSYANGNAHLDTDIDVAVVVNQVNGDYFDYTPLLWKLRREVDFRIEPILFVKNNDQSGFLTEIMRSGVEIES